MLSALRVRIRVSPVRSSRTAIVVSLTRVVSCQALWRVAGLARGLHRAIAMAARSASARDGAIWARRLHGSVARGALSGPVARNFQPRCRAITARMTNADRARWTRAPAVPPRVRAARRLVALTCRGRLGRSGGLTALVLFASFALCRASRAQSAPPARGARVGRHPHRATGRGTRTGARVLPSDVLP